MVATLLRYERGTRELLAVTDGGERALFGHTEARTVVSVPVDAHGVAAVDETRCRGVRDFGSWIRQRGTDFEWSHPRYERTR